MFADSVYLELNGFFYPNNSNVLWSRIGTNADGLFCKTTYSRKKRDATCTGGFYSSNGVQLPEEKSGHGIYVDKSEGFVSLNRRAFTIDAVAPILGKYRCQIKDFQGEKQVLYVNLFQW